MHVRRLLDGGAYGSYGVASTFYTARCRRPITSDLSLRRLPLFTNKPPCAPNAATARAEPLRQEIQLDKIAESLAIDPRSCACASSSSRTR